MVRKIATLFVVCTLLVGAFCTQASAATHSIYDEGTLSNTYITYFKDIISGANFNDNYICFRSGQYTYTMIVGDLNYSNGVITLSNTGKEYIFTSSSGYNSVNTYSVNTISNFSISVGNSIIYSDVGDFPQLIERGSKFEILNTVLLFIFMLCCVISRIFPRR